MSGDEYGIPVQKCPQCGHDIEAASGLEPEPERPPVVGDLNVCIECGGYLIFGPGLVLQRMSDAQYWALPATVRRAMFELRLAIEEVNRTGR